MCVYTVPSYMSVVCLCACYVCTALSSSVCVCVCVKCAHLCGYSVIINNIRVWLCVCVCLYICVHTILFWRVCICMPVSVYVCASLCVSACIHCYSEQRDRTGSNLDFHLHSPSSPATDSHSFFLSLRLSPPCPFRF